ncbi:MAG: aldehyde dehydrogenase [Acidobacteriales bacterium]|nr:aldehyde dehydrogenase [Terriglobales bacterium]
MAVGCPVVLKPAPQTPITALMLARVIQDAGWPAGALNVLPLANEDAAALVADDRLEMLSFTGSANVGWALKEKSGKKRVVLELGGNAAVIVHSDADVNDAATRCAFGGFTYAGQSCISVQRIFVQKDSYRQFTDALVPKVRALKCGDPLDETVDVGPLIRRSDAERIEQWISEAVNGGAKLLCGGKLSPDGRFIEPAVLTNTKPEQRVNCEEIFGPVVTVEPYEEFEDALKLANASRYGLQAGVFTSSPELITRAFDDLEVGGVIVNDVPTFRHDAMPYGGVKDSGLGREGVRYAIEEMTEMKLLVEQASR